MSQGSSPKAGTLFYLMGASGSGKDSIIQAVKSQLPSDVCATFVKRYITRPSQGCAESHFELTSAEFEQCEQQGAFLFSWQAHGYHYGISKEVLTQLDQGWNVVINGSRAYYYEACKRLSSLQAVVVQVSPQTLEKRLHYRNRENQQEISKRLARAIEFEAHLPDDVLRIDNNGPLDNAVKQLIKWLSH